MPHRVSIRRALVLAFLALSACGGAVDAACDAGDPHCTWNGEDASHASSPPRTADASTALDAGTIGHPGDASITADGSEASAPPSGLISSAPCENGGTVLYFEGANFTSTSSLTLHGLASSSADEEHVYFGMTTGSGLSLNDYHAEFSTEHLAEPIAVGLYTNAQRSPFEENGHAGLDVSGNGYGCNSILGSFRVDALTRNGDGGIDVFTVAFEEFCDGESTAIRGCLHIGP